MKKFLLLLSLSAFIHAAHAQNDLDVQNNSGCPIPIKGYFDSPACGSSILGIIPPGPSMVSGGVSYEVEIHDGGGSILGTVGDCMGALCGTTAPCSTNILVPGCGNFQFVFVPATGSSNAILIVNRIVLPDLDVVNNTGCDIPIDAVSSDGTCSPPVTYPVLILANTTPTWVTGAMLGEIFSVELGAGTGTSFSVGNCSTSICGSSDPCTFSAAIGSSCGVINVNASFVPATGFVNARVVIDP